MNPIIMPYVVDFNEFSSEDEKEYENFALTVYKDIIDSSPDILTRIDNSRWELTMESIFDIWEQFPKNFAPKDTVCKKKLLKYLEKYVDVYSSKKEDVYFEFSNIFKSWSDLQITTHNIWNSHWNLLQTELTTVNFVTYKELITIKDLPTWFMAKKLDHYKLLLNELLWYKENYCSVECTYSVRLIEDELKFVFTKLNNQPAIAESKSIENYPTRVARNESNACSICLFNEKNVAYSCGHMMCPQCAKKLEKQECPFCKKPLENPRELFPCD